MAQCWECHQAKMTETGYERFKSDLHSIQPDALLGEEGYRYWPAKVAMRKKEQLGYLQVTEADSEGIVTVYVWLSTRNSKHREVLLDYLDIFGFGYIATIRGNPKGGEE